MATKQQIVKKLNSIFKYSKDEIKTFWTNIKELPELTTLYSDGVPETRRYSYFSPASSYSDIKIDGKSVISGDETSFYISYRDWMPVNFLKKKEILACPLGSFVTYEASTEAPNNVFSSFGCVETLLKLDNSLSPTNEGFVATCSSQELSKTNTSGNVFDDMVKNIGMWYKFYAGFAQPYLEKKDQLNKTSSVTFFYNQLTDKTKNEHSKDENVSSIVNNLSNCTVDVALWNSTAKMDKCYIDENVKHIISVKSPETFKLLKSINQCHVELSFDEGSFLFSKDGSVEGEVSSEVVIERFVANSVFPSSLPQMLNFSCELDNGSTLSMSNPVFVNGLSSFTGTHKENHTYSKFENTDTPSNDALDIIKWVLENREGSNRPIISVGGVRKKCIVSFSSIQTQAFGYGLPCLTNVNISDAITGKTICDARFSQTNGGNLPSEMKDNPEYMLIARNCYDVKFDGEEERTFHAPQNGYISMQSTGDSTLLIKCVLFLGHPDAFVEIEGTVNKKAFVNEFLTIQIP